MESKRHEKYPLKLSAQGFAVIDGLVCPEIIFVQLVRKQFWPPCRVPITTACVNSVKHRSVNDDDEDEDEDDDDDESRCQGRSAIVENVDRMYHSNKSYHYKNEYFSRYFVSEIYIYIYNFVWFSTNRHLSLLVNHYYRYSHRPFAILVTSRELIVCTGPERRRFSIINKISYRLCKRVTNAILSHESHDSLFSNQKYLHHVSRACEN